MKKYIGDLFISRRWYLLVGSCVIFLFLAFFIHMLYQPALAYTCIIALFTLIDYILLFAVNGGIAAKRIVSPRFSIGDENTVTLTVANSYPFKIKGILIDELPVQFQQRNFQLDIIAGYRSGEIPYSYKLRPLLRGEFRFGNLVCYASTPLGLLRRRFTTTFSREGSAVKVYPSYLQLKKYQLLATTGSVMTGVKKVRRLGHSLEFEKIKDYVQGDDVRTINWKATARNRALMVNTYTDARQQQIYCLVDKGRSMKMPFEGLTLLDHSINACLAMLNVALLKQDKAGLITFSNKISDIIAADRRANQLHRILETLYKQETQFKESDYEAVWSLIHRSITQRSLILLFTNFETFSSLERQLPFLKKIAQRHLTCVVFFQNTLLKEIRDTHPDNIEGIYIKTIADQFDLEKKQIVKELRRHGILSILTTPQNLSVDVINKYLELKARQMV
ncbi:MAG: hypothetical protein K0Q79_642 [Flavipsychrobacter sp.]|nr:hypothetical protein [Flavipsychrobacter sp.]